MLYFAFYSFGYGFVEYEDPDDAARAIEQLNKHPIQHKVIKVAYSKPPGTENKNINLYVAGLPPNVTQEALQSFFSAAGKKFFNITLAFLRYIC